MPTRVGINQRYKAGKDVDEGWVGYSETVLDLEGSGGTDPKPFRVF